MNQAFGVSRRLEVGGIAISSKLIGSEMSFVESGHRITFSIPDKFEIKRCSLEGKKIISECRSRNYTTKGGVKKNLKTSFYLNEIDLFIEAKKKDHHFFLKKGVAKTRAEFNTFLFSTSVAAQKLKELGESLAQIGESAIESWLGCVRWKGNQTLASVSGQSFIFMGFSNSYEFAGANPARFFNRLSPTIELNMGSAILPNQWLEIERSLQDGNRQPIWNHYFTDALHRSRAYDSVGVILSCAISIEAFLQGKIEKTLAKIPEGNQAIIAVTRRIQISKILENLNGFSELAALQIDESELSEVRKIFDLRNEVMHGKRHVVSLNEANSALRTARQLIR